MSVKSLNEQISEILIKNNLVKEEALKACKLESELMGEDITKTLVKNGFLTQSQIIDYIIDVDEESLINEQVVIPTIKPDILIDNKVMLNAVTSDRVYYSTSKTNSIEEIEYLLKTNYFPKHQMKNIPCNIEKLRDYLEKIQSIYYDESSVIDRIIRKAIKEGASDIHIVPNYDTYTILYRYLGVRHPDQMGLKEEYNQLSARIKDLSKMDMAEKRKPQDGSFQMEYNGKLVDLRVATVPTPDGEQIIIRILDPDKAQLNLENLGITELNEWRKGAGRSDGLCLICGPTGSGKTTTLNSTIREQDRFGKAIYTIEDPVEYRIPYVGQVNINSNVGLDFARAVRAFMRADPDIIVIGEVRDEETARNAIKAAETGHLVFATLHTGSILGSVNRLRDLGIDPHELKYVLRSIMVQRLIRVTCKICNGSGVNKATDSECKNCKGHGYSGRTVVSEIKYFSDLKDVSKVLKHHNKENFNNSENEYEDEISWNTMLDDAYNKFLKGQTSPGELIRVFATEAENKLIQDGYDLSLINDKGFFNE